jgi:hypothetical protein
MENNKCRNTSTLNVEENISGERASQCTGRGDHLFKCWDIVEKKGFRHVLVLIEPTG